jgi:FkbM family methyltransferase
MRTRHKLMLAKAAYHLLHRCRAVVGATDDVTVSRAGAVYRLDLSQGIDFALYLGAFERGTAAACARLVRPGSTVLDIGANIGAHTLRLAKLVGDDGKVFAFEPTLYAFQKLTRNLALNDALSARVMALQAFLGPRSGGFAPTAIPSAWPLGHEDELHAKHFGKSMSTEGAATTSVDDFVEANAIPRIDFVKLDVDGFECDVLEGAQAMLRRDRPTFVMEIAPYVLAERGASLERLLKYLVPLGYRFLGESDGRLLPDSADGLAGLVPDGASMNVIAVAGESPAP